MTSQGAIAPIVVDIAGDTRVLEHPAFGQIEVNRVDGGAYLYGSEFRHDRYVTISINKSQLVQSASQDRYQLNGELVRVALTESGWATLVSSIGLSGGVPCTLQRKDNLGVPTLPSPKSRRERFDEEMSDEVKKALGALEGMGALIKNSGLSKKKQDELMDRLDESRRLMELAVPYLVERFGEHMAETLDRARCEIAAHMNASMRSTGLSSATGDGPGGSGSVLALPD